MRFANESGIILELEKSSIGDALRYFNCSLISCYPEEDEHLFIGGKQPLQFKSIRLVSNKFNLQKFVKGLSLLDKIVNAQMLKTERERKRVSKRDHKVNNFIFLFSVFCFLFFRYSPYIYFLSFFVFGIFRLLTD